MRYNEIVKKGNLIHNNKYAYPKFDKAVSNDKIKIICPYHGEFQQVVYAHLRGQGCPQCAHYRSNYTTEKFIKEATEKFGDKFDYSKVIYKGKRVKICIMCKNLISKDNPTGEFWQMPFIHLNSTNGMPFLGKRKRDYPILKDDKKIKMKTKQFIEKARKIHGDKYDYSKTIYKGALQKLTIICLEHGEFTQIPNNHLKGCGCPRCAKNKKLTINRFIDEANLIHNNKYDYSKTIIKNYNEKICITCPIHGDFLMTISRHLRGSGCQKCAKNKKPTIEEFIARAKEIHGDKYDYSKVNYVNNHTNVSIICPKHGEFLQTPSAHLNARNGCPICNESKLEKEIELLLQENRIDYVRQKKFKSIKFINLLPFDFYLPKYHLVIECQGLQHFENEHFFNDEKRFEKDKIKYYGCLNKQIRIFYYTNIKNYKSYFNEIYNKKNLFNNKNELLKQIKNLGK